MKNNIIEMWRARRANASRPAWTKHGITYYPTIMDGFPKKNITRMPDVAVRRYIDVTSKRRWLYWVAASKSGPKWARIWR